MKIAILGVGAYAIALARVFNKNKDNEVMMWAKFKEEASVVIKKRENPSVLPGVKIPDNIKITMNLGACMEGASIVILAVPAVAVRQVSEEVSVYAKKDQILCVVSKGIEPKTNMFMSEILYQATKNENICMISGPSFAIEIAKGAKTGFNIACKNIEIANIVKEQFENGLVVSTCDDIIGVQVAASIKNVFAIFMGMLTGMDMTDSYKASCLACLVRDLGEVIVALGGKRETIFTYAGLGDMLLTCMSSKSRNFTFGTYIGRGYSMKNAFETMSVKTVEGIYTLSTITDLMQSKNFKIKSLEVLYGILYNNDSKDNLLDKIRM